MARGGDRRGATHAWRATLTLLGCLPCAAADERPSSSSPSSPPTAEARAPLREFQPQLDGRWIGGGIAYGPYRPGQRPGGPLPSREEVAEDLRLIAARWNLLRLYGSSEIAEPVLEAIRAERLPIRVLLGSWIADETPSAEWPAANAQRAQAANARETQEQIRLALAYPDEVVALNVGNETQVFWSDHRTSPEVLLRYLRQVRAATHDPVTTADDFNFWNKPESQPIAAEVDFLAVHIHALWAGVPLADALAWTERIHAEVGRVHPGKTLVIAEAGWATRSSAEGEQAKLIRGPADEDAQRVYYRDFVRWAADRRIASFYFEAFDEPWKGGPREDEVEKHWGLFFADRTPKKALLPDP